MGKTFFTSDLHHEHKRIVEFTKRGEETTQERHSTWLMEKWNSQVTVGDLVYHLGDFSFSRDYKDIALFVSRLQGQKIFIKGNHDDRKVLTQLVKDGLIQAWYDYKEIKIADQTICLFHFPMVSWHKQGYGSWHLHGHTHGNLKTEHQLGCMLDVGIDSAKELYDEHFLFSFEDVCYHMEGKQRYIADHHKER